MKNVFENAKNIWLSQTAEDDSYAEFVQKINYSDGTVKVRLSVSNEYTLFVNGEYAGSIQYADFVHYKVYDEIDITKLLSKGENTVAFVVWYWKKSGMRHNSPMAGLIYEIENDGEIVAVSSKDTLSRKSKAYISGVKREISGQLGYSFNYDAKAEDGWMTGTFCGFGQSTELSKSDKYFLRPIKKHDHLAPIKALQTKENKNIYDLGKEHMGVCSISFTSKKAQKVVVWYGELLKDGQIKKHIGNRHFCFEYYAKEGENVYTNYMLRLAGRYFEIECEDEIELDYIALIPEVYPVKTKAYDLGNKLDNDIYEACLHTLRLCMMEHYVDCPWREQCLYAFDSRNQMLIGYHAYEDGNFEYARANLLLMGKDNRADGLMSICYPSAEELVIPSFGLHYVRSVLEYTKYSGDKTLADEVFAKLTSLLSAFMNNREDGLVCRFQGKEYWNFYDWSAYASGTLHDEQPRCPDFLINAIAVVALNAYAEICEILSKENVFSGISQEISRLVNEKYYNEKTGTYFILSADEEPTELASSFAVYSGIAKGERAEAICKNLAEKKYIECSLSLKIFKYDAMLSVDREGYKAAVLDEIRKTYEPMTTFGTGTVWETAKGESDFSTAASLCHGWSAVPIYYYNTLCD